MFRDERCILGFLFIKWEVENCKALFLVQLAGPFFKMCTVIGLEKVLFWLVICDSLAMTG